MRNLLIILISLFLFLTSCNHKKTSAKDNKTLQSAKIQWAVTGGHAIDTASLLFAVSVSPNIMFEKAICKLAETKASHASIRLFAEQLILDGDTTNDAFFQAIIKKGFLIADELEPEQEKELNALAKQNKNFDHAFLITLTQHFKRSVTFYEDASTTLDYAALKRYAVIELAIKQDHLEAAERLMKQMD